MKELDEADVFDDGFTPGGEIFSEVQVIPQRQDEWSVMFGDYVVER